MINLESCPRHLNSAIDGDVIGKPFKMGLDRAREGTGRPWLGFCDVDLHGSQYM